MVDYRLFIDGYEIDYPSEGLSILFQKQRSDYTNPTIVRNSFTKTIRLPNTAINSFIFNKYWKLDRVQGSGPSPYGTHSFNASKRTPFHLTVNGNLAETGYVKLDDIEWNGGDYVYDITLYGELGNLLYGLSYSIDDETETVTPLTLADLDYEFNGFGIDRTLVEYAWKRLDGQATEDQYKIFDTINFMVSYDGIPQADNFDTKKVWCSVDRMAAVYWVDADRNSKYYYANEFPESITVTEDGQQVVYNYVNTQISRMDPEDHYGLLELKNDVTPLEMRDLRSYLLRPVIRVKKIFEAIGRYIDAHYGYDLDMSDEFFASNEFNSSWMTLSMLYEIDPAVETGTVFGKRQLLNNTSSPASYLISYCKTYGIYLDADYINKKLVLTRLPRWFENKVDVLKIDSTKGIKILPLSFDKSAYSFDYGEGESEFYKKYKDTYGSQYGSKRVNTGYRFDASVAPYIDNNVFKQGVDSIDQSIYYKYPYAVANQFGNTILFDYPGGLMDEANLPEFKLFNINTQLGETKTFGGEMRPHWYPGVRQSGSIYAYNIPNDGYQFMNVWWNGLRPQVWQDGFPKLQCHSEDNKAVDGRNILVRFDGFRQTSYGKLTETNDKIYWNAEGYSDYNIDATKVNYLLSDDNGYLKSVLGMNCYYDCPIPSEGYGYNYMKVINRIPQFSRSSYMYSMDTGDTPVFYVAGFDQMTISGTDAVSITASASYFTADISSSSGRQYPYFTTMNFDANHRYFIAAAVKTSSAGSILSGNDYAHPDIIGSELIDSSDLVIQSDVQVIGSIVQLDGTVPTQITPLSTYNIGSSVSYNMYYLVVFDLTELGLEDYITRVSVGLQYFGLTDKKSGYMYKMMDTLEFGVPRELYVPSCTYEQGIGIYNKYWSKYISDLYSINTRVIELYCYLDDINDEAFKKFYLYDGCLWILSKVVDWSCDTNYCKATFIKVNNRDNYISE